MGSTLRLPFEVLRGQEVVATGIVGEEAVRLLPGEYRVRLLGAAAPEVGTVTVEPGGERTVDAGGAGE